MNNKDLRKIETKRTTGTSKGHNEENKTDTHKTLKARWVEEISKIV